MMRSIGRYFISLDGFGESVGVNYRGEDSFKTWQGASCTTFVRGFILIYTLLACIEVAQYNDP